MSADDHPDPTTVDTQGDLQRLLRRYSARLDELEAELAREREARQQLEERVDAYEELVDVRSDGSTVELADIYIGGVPVGRIVQSKASGMDVEELQERVDDLHTTPDAEADPERTLPIQQVTRTWKADPSALDNANARRAAIVWSNYFDTATRTPSKILLSSGDVRTILAAKDESTHDETVSRVMERVADLGKEYVVLEKRDGTNHLVIDKDEWETFVQDLRDHLQGGDEA